jgi:hypothetical protein
VPMTRAFILNYGSKGCDRQPRAQPAAFAGTPLFPCAPARRARAYLYLQGCTYRKTKTAVDRLRIGR